MRLISHRGNTKGRNEPAENSPDYVKNTIKKGFDVEIDVWLEDRLYLGHDKPEYKCSMNFLVMNASKLWIHCENLEALEALNGIKRLNIFWHQKDDHTLTSKGYIWTYPNKKVCEKSVIVVKNALSYDGTKCHGLCSDIIEE